MPIAKDGYPAELSFFQSKHLLNLISRKFVEVIGNDELLTLEEVQSTQFCFWILLQRNHFNHWLSCFGDDEGLTIRGLINETRKMSLCLVNVEGFHNGSRSKIVD